MGHDQLFEFIDIFQRFNLSEMNRYVGESKTYLHLAVMQMNKQLVSYLLFDAKVDPNLLTIDTQLAALHIACQLKDLDIIDILLQCDKLDVNLCAPQKNGETALHMACRLDEMQIVQRLLLSGADFTIRSAKNKVAKEVTKNQRIVYLIEKYEKRGLSNITGKDITSEDDDDVMIFQEEEEKGEFSQRRMSHGNNQSGGVTQALAQAEQYIDEFFSSEIELIPNITGHLKYWRGEKLLRQTKP